MTPGSICSPVFDCIVSTGITSQYLPLPVIFLINPGHLYYKITKFNTILENSRECYFYWLLESWIGYSLLANIQLQILFFSIETGMLIVTEDLDS